VDGKRHAPVVFTPGKESIVIEYKTGWAPGLFWTGEENLASQGFDIRTFQHVASRYIDYTIPVNLLLIYAQKLICLALSSIVVCTAYLGIKACVYSDGTSL